MLLAQTTTGQALDILRDSLELSNNTAQSWASLWNQTIFFYNQSALWIALVTLGLTLAGASVLYLAVTEGKEIIEKQAWSGLATMLIWPLIVAVFLGNNGGLLSESIKFIRGVGLNEIQTVQEIQLSDFTLRQALQQISITQAAREQIDAIYNECIGKQGMDFADCLTENRPAIEQILAEAERANGRTLQALRDFVQGLFTVVANPGQIGENIANGNFSASVFRSIAIPIVRFILSSIQWAFVNLLEASLLLTAAFAPIAMGLSLLPLQGRPIFAWLIGFISLLGVQLGYNIIVGLTAIVVVNSNGELITDIAFLFFLAIFAPILAVLISSGGGIALYRGISNNTKRIVDLISVSASKFV